MNAYENIDLMETKVKRQLCKQLKEETRRLETKPNVLICNVLPSRKLAYYRLWVERCARIKKELKYIGVLKK